MDVKLGLSEEELNTIIEEAGVRPEQPISTNSLKSAISKAVALNNKKIEEQFEKQVVKAVNEAIKKARRGY